MTPGRWWLQVAMLVLAGLYGVSVSVAWLPVEWVFWVGAAFSGEGSRDGSVSWEFMAVGLPLMSFVLISPMLLMWGWIAWIAAAVMSASSVRSLLVTAMSVAVFTAVLAYAGGLFTWVFVCVGMGWLR